MSKTPVTVLQELCVKYKNGPPIYELVEDGIGDLKMFMYKLSAFDQNVYGRGRSKKDAKHEAANLMLVKLQTNSSEIDDFSMPQSQTTIEGNSVGELLDICVQRNIPIPEFKLLNASGPSHAPEFTFECCIASIVRQATHSTKKGAKQMVAQKMVFVLQNMAQDDDKMQVSVLGDVIDEESVKNTSTIRTYLELKNSDSKFVPGIKLKNRHNFFKDLDDTKRIAAMKLIKNLDDSEENVSQIVKALELNYEITDIASALFGKQKLFELKGDYDCVLVAPEKDLYKTIISYIKLMIE